MSAAMSVKKKKDDCTSLNQIDHIIKCIDMTSNVTNDLISSWVLLY